MMPILSEEQRRALALAEGPIEVVDPATNVSYVLIRADVFARVASQADPDLMSDSDPFLLLGAGAD